VAYGPIRTLDTTATHEDRIRDADAQRHVRAAQRSRPASKRTRSPLTTWLVVLAAAVSALLVPLAHAQQQTLHNTSSVYRFTDFGAVDGATSTLIHGSDDVAVTLTTEGLAPDAPYTLWWVVFNEAADISILFADGTLTDAAGRAAFSGVLYVDRPLGEVVLGHGLRDASTSEVHVVVRTTHRPRPTLVARARGALLDGLNGRWFDRALGWYLLLVGSHVVEHVAQLAQVTLLLPGFAGSGAAARWWRAALVLQSWHWFEHAFLQVQFVTGVHVYGAIKQMSVLERSVPRVEPHVAYNLAVFVPTLVAIALVIGARRRGARRAG